MTDIHLDTYCPSWLVFLRELWGHWFTRHENGFGADIGEDFRSRGVADELLRAVKRKELGGVGLCLGMKGTALKHLPPLES